MYFLFGPLDPYCWFSKQKPCLLPRPREDPKTRSPQFWTLGLLWCRLQNPKEDLLFGSAQGSGLPSPPRTFMAGSLSRGGSCTCCQVETFYGSFQKSGAPNGVPKCQDPSYTETKQVPSPNFSETPLCISG